jgi:hypothetical protein
MKELSLFYIPPTVDWEAYYDADPLRAEDRVEVSTDER